MDRFGASDAWLMFALYQFTAGHAFAGCIGVALCVVYMVAD